MGRSPEGAVDTAVREQGSRAPELLFGFAGKGAVLAQVVHSAVAAKLLQSCLTLCNPVDSSPPDSSVHGILQARTLECVPFLLQAVHSRGSNCAVLLSNKQGCRGGVAVSSAALPAFP